MLWKVETDGFSGIHLKPIEPFGDSFVYNTTNRIARELGIFSNEFWGGAFGTSTAIYRTTTVEQARELREQVQHLVCERKAHLENVKDALEGVDDAMVALRHVKKILEG